METLRRAHRLTCLLLAWFALSVGVAMAAPVLQSDAGDVVCSGAGTMKSLAGDEGNAPDGSGHKHDCRLCVPFGAPPEAFSFALHEAPAEAPAPVLPVPVARQSAAPFQQRGPPLS